MPRPPLLQRFKKSRFARVLIIYAGASWPILGVVGTLQDVLLLPDWVSPAALILLLVGLLAMLVMEWLQSGPGAGEEEDGEGSPDPWEIGLHELVRDLRGGRVPHLTWGRVVTAGFFSFWLLFGLAGVYVLVADEDGASIATPLVAEGAGAGLAVMPFSTSGVDPEVYGEGMVSLLSTTLDGVAGVRAIDSRTVFARWREEVDDVDTPDLARILDVGQEAGARYVLVGSALELGSSLGLVGNLYDLERGTKLGDVRVEGSPEALLALVDRFSVRAARILLAEGGEEMASVQHVGSLTTESLPALMAYLEGERHYRMGHFARALEAYDRAIAADSTFALASLRAALAYGWEEGNPAPATRAHRERAVRYADRLPARERALLAAVVGEAENDPAAIERLEEQIRRYPDDSDLWNALGELYVHVGRRAAVSPEEAIVPLERAVVLEPDFAPYLVHLTDHAISHGDSADAARWLQRERGLAPDAVFTRWHGHAFILAHGSDPREREAVLDSLRSLGRVPGYLMRALAGPRWPDLREAAFRAAAGGASDDNPIPPRNLGYTLMDRGKVTAALEVRPDGGDVSSTMIMTLALVGLADPDTLDLRRFDDLHATLTLSSGGWSEALESGLDDLPEFLGATAIALATLRSGRPAEAVPLLEDLLTETSRGPIVGVTLFWLGQAHEALGDDRVALRYFRASMQSPWPDPQASLARLRAARLHRRLREPEQERALYRELLIAWQDADPSFQPWIDEARRALSDAGS